MGPVRNLGERLRGYVRFERWEESGLDWFTFHSGTWCGPPASGSSVADRLERLMPGTWALWRGLRARLWPDPLLRATPDDLLRYVLEARDAAENAGAHSLVVLIPEKQTALRGPTADAARHEALAERLRESGVEVVDLRAPFTSAAFSSTCSMSSRVETPPISGSTPPIPTPTKKFTRQPSGP